MKHDSYNCIINLVLIQILKQKINLNEMKISDQELISEINKQLIKRKVFMNKI